LSGGCELTAEAPGSQVAQNIMINEMANAHRYAYLRGLNPTATSPSSSLLLHPPPPTGGSEHNNQ
ncbi:unnamed protein product, partial [Closterium sp. NIES-53]